MDEARKSCRHFGTLPPPTRTAGANRFFSDFRFTLTGIRMRIPVHLFELIYVSPYTSSVLEMNRFARVVRIGGTTTTTPPSKILQPQTPEFVGLVSSPDVSRGHCEH